MKETRLLAITVALCALAAFPAAAVVPGPAFPICTAPNDQLSPEVSGGTVVWNDDRKELTDYTGVYGHDLTSGEEFPIATDYSTNYYQASISGSKVVWSGFPRVGLRGKAIDQGSTPCRANRQNR